MSHFTPAPSSTADLVAHPPKIPCWAKVVSDPAGRYSRPGNGDRPLHLGDYVYITRLYDKQTGVYAISGTKPATTEWIIDVECLMFVVDEAAETTKIERDTWAKIVKELPEPAAHPSKKGENYQVGDYVLVARVDGDAIAIRCGIDGLLRVPADCLEPAPGPTAPVATVAPREDCWAQVVVDPKDDYHALPGSLCLNRATRAVKLGDYLWIKSHHLERCRYQQNAYSDSAIWTIQNKYLRFLKGVEPVAVTPEPSFAEGQWVQMTKPHDGLIARCVALIRSVNQLTKTAQLWYFNGDNYAAVPFEKFVVARNLPSRQDAKIGLAVVAAILSDDVILPTQGHGFSRLLRTGDYIRVKSLRDGYATFSCVETGTHAIWAKNLRFVTAKETTS